jgi:hypothetical protein
MGREYAELAGRCGEDHAHCRMQMPVPPAPTGSSPRPPPASRVLALSALRRRAGPMLLSIHALGRAPGLRLVVDTCVGNDRQCPADGRWRRIPAGFRGGRLDRQRRR